MAETKAAPSPPPLAVDLCVIGAGAAGLSFAAGAAQLGLSVVLFEAHVRPGAMGGAMGGDCLHTGCVPSKALIAAGKAAKAARGDARFGVTAAGAPVVDWAAVRAHVDGVIAGIAPHDSVARFEGLGVTVVQARARFVDRRTVEGGGLRVSARRFVLATGGRPLVPPIPGLDAVPYLTNETVFGLDRLPDHLIVIGGGPIGCELGQAFRRLGAAVTIIEAARILGREDEALAAPVRAALAEDGVTLVEQAQVSAVAALADGTLQAQIRAADGAMTVIAGSHVLVAVGRLANVEDLGLDRAGIAATRHGITVDARLQTSNPRVVAIGDCAGPPHQTHIAGEHASLMIRRLLFRLPTKLRPLLLPRVTYTEPQIAQVGMTAAQAAALAGEGFRVLSARFADNDRARTERDTAGSVQVVVDRRGRVRGAGIVGCDAGDLLAPWCLALANGMKIGAMAQLVLPYPTRSEAGKRAAASAFTAKLFSDRTRAIVRFLFRFGRRLD